MSYNTHLKRFNGAPDLAKIVSDVAHAMDDDFAYREQSMRYFETNHLSTERFQTNIGGNSYGRIPFPGSRGDENAARFMQHAKIDPAQFQQNLPFESVLFSPEMVALNMRQNYYFVGVPKTYTSPTIPAQHANNDFIPATFQPGR
jgi:hypothetical protein